MMLLFAGGWWLPKTVDAGPHLSTGPSVVIDLLLVALFGLQHSGMARPSFKAFITRWVPEALERTVYIVMASLAVWVLCLGWQPLPQRIWSSTGILGAVLDAGFWLGCALVYAATLLLNHFHLLGFSQAYRAYVRPRAGRDLRPAPGAGALPPGAASTDDRSTALLLVRKHIHGRAPTVGGQPDGLHPAGHRAGGARPHRSLRRGLPLVRKSSARLLPVTAEEIGLKRMNQTGPVAADSHEQLETTVAIIGSGFSGLGMAIQLRKRGREDFLILEKSHDVGGVWRDNTYPGCGCDVPTTVYSYSFEQNPFWSKMWSSQPEIYAYLRRMADKYDLRRKTLFGAEVVAASWDSAASRWRLRSADGRTIIARFLVMGIGPMTAPKLPEIKGIESFTGAAFHSARWDHAVDLTGKKVAVIGTGASAIQFVPVIAEQVGQLQLYQRTPPWVLTRFDPGIPKSFRTLFAKVPLIRSIFRATTYWIAEAQAIALHGYGILHKPLEWAAKAHIRKRIKDPALAAKLTPDYQIGCKRILYSPTYYPALARPNAEVVTDGIAEVRPGSIVTVDGTERAVDVIIYGTGFNLTGPVESLNIRLGDGESLMQRWRTSGMQAHMGVTVAGMPNAFFLMGPNSAIAHNSIVFMIEQQIKLVLRAMDGMQQRAATAIQIRTDAQERFNGNIQRRLGRRVWSSAGCRTYFVDDDGVNRVLWPGFSWEYWRAVRNFDETQYEFTGTDQDAAAGDAHASGYANHVAAPA